jgi:hypothetical protein
MSMATEKKPIDAGILDRVVQGVKYIIQGNKSNLWFSPGDPIAPQAHDDVGQPVGGAIPANVNVPDMNTTIMFPFSMVANISDNV